jgi:hypothetical protein
VLGSTKAVIVAAATMVCVIWHANCMKGWGNGSPMRVISALLATPTGFAALAPPESLFASQRADGRTVIPAGNSQPGSGSLHSGCEYRPQNRFVLADDRDLIPVVDLEADGFPTAGFAIHSGRKARGVETSVAACAPLPQSDRK